MQRIFLLLTIVLLLPVCALAQNAPDRPLITVSGQAEISVTPDIAVFTLRVVTLDKDLNKAKAINDESVKKTLALAKSYQIAPADMQTNYLSVDTQYSEDETAKRPPLFLGYEVTKKIVLTLRDMSRIESLLADVLKAGVNRIDNLDFRTTQIRKYRDQARAMAIKAAREKAVALTGEIGQNIGKAFTITEEGLGNYSSAASNNYISQNRSTSVGGDYSDTEGTIAVGQISITARVIVSFELK
jgi:uncharacterized protein